MLSLTRSKYLFFRFFYSSILRAHTRRCSAFYVHSIVGTCAIAQEDQYRVLSLQITSRRVKAQSFFFHFLFAFGKSNFHIWYHISHLPVEYGIGRLKLRFALFLLLCKQLSTFSVCNIHKKNWRLFEAISLELSRRFRIHPNIGNHFLPNLQFMVVFLVSGGGHALSTTYRIY